MSDYTPTTEDIRAGWEYATAVIGDEGTAQFDRWLAEVRAEAWEEGWRSRNSKRLSFSENPYLQGEEHTHTKRSSFGDPYCKTCGIDLEGETE